MTRTHHRAFQPQPMVISGLIQPTNKPWEYLVARSWIVGSHRGSHLNCWNTSCTMGAAWLGSAMFSGQAAERSLMRWLQKTKLSCWQCQAPFTLVTRLMRQSICMGLLRKQTVTGTWLFNALLKGLKMELDLAKRCFLESQLWGDHLRNHCNLTKAKVSMDNKKPSLWSACGILQKNRSPRRTQWMAKIWMWCAKHKFKSRTGKQTRTQCTAHCNNRSSPIGVRGANG